MRTFREVAGKELTWVRVGRRKDRHFELRSSEQAVAELVFDSRRADHARARSGDGEWRFQRTGVVRAEIRVTPEPAEGGSSPSAVLHPGRLLRATRVDVGEEDYAWRREGLLLRWRSLDDETGPLIRARRAGLGVVGKGRLEIQAAAFARPELPLLALIGWYLTARNQGKENG